MPKSHPKGHTTQICDHLIAQKMPRKKLIRTTCCVSVGDKKSLHSLFFFLGGGVNDAQARMSGWVLAGVISHDLFAKRVKISRLVYSFEF